MGGEFMIKYCHIRLNEYKTTGTNIMIIDHIISNNFI